MRFEVVGLLQALAQNAVVVDLAIDGQGNGLVLVDKRLSAGIYAIVSPCLVLRNLVTVSAYQRRRCSIARVPELRRVSRVHLRTTRSILTCVVRDPIATCLVSVIVSWRSVIRGLLTPIGTPMSDAGVAISN